MSILFKKRLNTTVLTENKKVFLPSSRNKAVKVKGTSCILSRNHDRRLHSDYYRSKFSSKRNNSEIRSYSFFYNIRFNIIRLYESRSYKRSLLITILLDGSIEIYILKVPQLGMNKLKIRVLLTFINYKSIYSKYMKSPQVGY